MAFFVFLMLFVIRGFINGDKLELKANVGKCLVVGETLELNCSITNSNEINNLNLTQLNLQHRGSRLVNQSIIDNRTLQAVISNVGKGDSGTYKCRSEGDLKSMINLVFEITDHDPMPEDIDCIANGVSTQVNCTWRSRDLCATWRLFYSKTGDPEAECVLPVQKVQKGCANHTIDSNKSIKTRCRQLPPPEGEPLQWRCRVDISFLSDFSLRLERNNPFGTEKKIFHKRFDHTIVKLDADQNLQVHSSSTTISLDWKFRYPPKYYYNGIRCNVSCGMETQTLIFLSNITNDDVTGILFTDLHPFTEYNITVICKVSGSRYWGDPLYRTYQTEEDIPLVGPHTTDASYTLAGCISGGSGTCLTIHTKVDTLNVRGNMKGYAVEIRSSRIPELKQRFDFSNSSTSLEIGPLDNGMIPPFYVSIWSKTSKGLSNRSTDIVINPNKDIAFQEVIAEEQDAIYLITAEILPSSASSEITCHWCYGLKMDKTMTCKGGYGYRNSSKPEFMMEKSKLYGSDVIAKEDNKYRWYFGMSVSTGADSTGIHWEDCLFRSTKHNFQSPPQPERPVLSEGIRNQIIVHVQSFCPVNSNSESFRPMNYTVVYTYNDEFNDEKATIVEARYNDDRLEINDLKPGSTYNVKYNIGYRQSTSPYSEPAFKYISAQPQVELIVGLAVGITFFILFVILMIWKLAKWYHKIEQPIESVEIDNNTWGKSYVDPIDCYDAMCVESSQVEDVKHKIVAECNKGHDPKHQASKILWNKPDPNNYKLASREICDILAPQYNIIGSITSEEDLDVEISGSDRFEKSMIVDDGMCSNKSFASVDADAIAMFHQSTMSSDITRHATATRRDQRPGDEIGICNHFLTTSSVYSENSDKADNTQGSPEFTENKPMNGCCQSVSEAMLDEEDIAVILLCATKAIDDEDDSCQQHIGDFLGIPPTSLSCINQQFPSQQTLISERPPKSLSGYKRLPQAETYPVFRSNIGHELFKTSETDDEPCTSDAELELHVPTEPFALIETLDTQQIDTNFKLDDTSRESTNQTRVLGRITEPAGSQKPVKTHYKTFPCS